MITTNDFKKQIAKPFGQEMRKHGFKGTGFEYHQEDDDYLIAVGIYPGRWGGECTAGLAVHPKQVDHDYYGKINFEKLKSHQYEFRMGLAKGPNSPSWKYADDVTTNLDTLSEILATIKQVAFPVIEQFKANPGILELFEVEELDLFHKNWTKRTGVYMATTKERFAWATTLVLEKRNLKKSKKFAAWCLYCFAEEGGKEWFGIEDLKRVLAAQSP